jgi:pimeloyl-ACP methyl ester carboxylesterase
VHPPSSEDRDARRFTGAYERRLLPGVGHNVPQEAPEAAVAAVLTLLAPG